MDGCKRMDYICKLRETFKQNPGNCRVLVKIIIHFEDMGEEIPQEYLTTLQQAYDQGIYKFNGFGRVIIKIGDYVIYATEFFSKGRVTFDRLGKKLKYVFQAHFKNKHTPTIPFLVSLGSYDFTHLLCKNKDKRIYHLEFVTRKSRTSLRDFDDELSYKRIKKVVLKYIKKAIQKCNACGVTNYQLSDRNVHRLYQCRRCKTKYCCQSCYLGHWVEHKSKCKRLGGEMLNKD